MNYEFTILTSGPLSLCIFML